MRGKVSLKSINTFGINAYARKIIKIRSEYDLVKFLSLSKGKEMFYVLGEGSNVLFTRDYDGVILKMETKGIEIVSKIGEQVTIRAKAGEDWDGFVRYCLKHNYCGLENLALIPGRVGSCPIQNIGAYGKEVKDYITKVYAIDVSDMSLHVFENNDCKFGYRTSIFKQGKRGQYIITDVEFRLIKGGIPDVTYSDIKNELSDVVNIKAQDVYNVVSRIRSTKLPDCKVLGNAGSFFKNPVVSISHFERLKKRYADLKSYPVSDKECKMSAAQLIQIAGWKGKRIGDAGVHVNQPLVLVNYGNASGKDILNLAKQIQNSVFDLFKIELEIEVNII